MKLFAGSSPVGAFFKSALHGYMFAMTFCLSWWLAYLMEWVPLPNLDGTIEAFLPIFRDLGRFAKYNLTHNLFSVVLAGALFAVYEITLRRDIARGLSLVGTMKHFQSASMMLGLFTMTISLDGMLATSGEQGQEIRSLIGSLYFKLGLWTLNFLLMWVRYVWHEHTQHAQARA